MTGRVIIVHEGNVYDPFEPGKGWQGMRSLWTTEEAAFYRQVIEEGEYRLPDGEPLPPLRVKLVRATLLGTYGERPQMAAPSEVVRDLIPGLWRWGGKPMLGGPPKVGKSTFVAELVAALVIEGRRFLGHFDPVELTRQEHDRGIWLINAENPPDELHQALLAAGLRYNEGDLLGYPFYDAEGCAGYVIVEHLEALGGPTLFDLTVEENYDRWASYLMQCPCDGIHDREPPLAVIADGVTAILNTKTDRYGEWYAAFRRLMQALDVPNALGVAHNGLAGKHLMNGTESMAGPDGLWTYWAPNPDEPKSPRYFWTVPRLHAPTVEKSRVVIGEDRMLLLRRKAQASEEEAGIENEEPDQELSHEAIVLDRLRAAEPSGVSASDLTGGGREGKILRAARDRLVAKALIHSKAQGQSTRYFLSPTH